MDLCGVGLRQEYSGTFTYVMAMNVTHATLDNIPAPGAVADSGTMDLIVMRDVNCCAMACALLAMEDGTVGASTCFVCDARVHCRGCVCVVVCGMGHVGICSSARAGVI